ncbi:MAG: hypothetical protein K6T90_20130, partial [Leptolyngbyaceae cyanobacterium HOT.MB2.61]|nr:hypothetical protein [Leptolyngbyaceae cyanobacterium HOT.MB2.61]
TTASTDHFLGAFGLTDNLEGRVQGLAAEPANGEAQRRLVTFASPPRSLDRPLQRSVGLLLHITIPANFAKTALAVLHPHQLTCQSPLSPNSHVPCTYLA